MALSADCIVISFLLKRWINQRFLSGAERVHTLPERLLLAGCIVSFVLQGVYWDVRLWFRGALIVGGPAGGDLWLGLSQPALFLVGSI